MNVFITGVSRGLGYGLAKTFLKRNYKVYGVARSTPPQDLFDLPGFHYQSCDLHNFENIKTVLDELLPTDENFRYSILNAGIIGKVNSMKNSSLGDLKDVMDVNVWSNKFILDYFLENSVHTQTIIAISSGASVSGNYGWNGYSISKAALNMMVSLYSHEFTERQIYSFAPGLIETSMQDYIANEVDLIAFPTMQRLIDARGTEIMPAPETAAEKIIDSFKKLELLPSGSYADIRNLDVD
ncbi:MAG: SDR family NAD(P)-dependent oxidoreductase [Leptospirales bacterium]